MKKSKAKYATLAGVVLSAGILLSACGNSSTASKTYNYGPIKFELSSRKPCNDQ